LSADSSAHDLKTLMTDKRQTRICLIDDDIYVRDALAIGLRDAGYDVTTAPGAVAGLDHLMHAGADAIITDMSMPGTDGATLISQVRTAWPQMPIIAISGASQIEGRDMVEVARESGASAILAKPFRVLEMVALLGRLVSSDVA